MFGPLSPDQEEVRKKLIKQWIGERQTVDSKIDGCTTLIDTFCTALATLLGEVATRAILSRALVKAREDHPELNHVFVAENCLDADSLREALENHKLSEAQEILVGIIDQLFTVLRELIGSALTPVLQQVEVELAAIEPAEEEGT